MHGGPLANKSVFKGSSPTALSPGDHLGSRSCHYLAASGGSDSAGWPRTWQKGLTWTRAPWCRVPGFSTCPGRDQFHTLRSPPSAYADAEPGHT